MSKPRVCWLFYMIFNQISLLLSPVVFVCKNKLLETKSMSRGWEQHILTTGASNAKFCLEVTWPDSEEFDSFAKLSGRRKDKCLGLVCSTI